jgi:acyl-CoA dehydrogenase
LLCYEQWKNSSASNWYTDDPILTRYAKRYLTNSVLEYVEPRFISTGVWAASKMDSRAKYTDREGAPVLIRYDREGNEINTIWYNDGYLQTVKEGFGTGVVSLRYDQQAPEQIPFLVNEILYYIMSESETGFTCPVSLTQGTAFVIEKFGSPEQKEKYLHRLGSSNPETLLQGATWLTEIQGGSDVGATQTVATKNGDHYLLTGEKWFASNCDADVSIALARVNDKPGTRGLGLFIVPRLLENKTPNRVTIRRLKDKLGVRAVASGELILNEAVGYLIGEEDKGFLYMAEALNVSRLGTALKGLAIARRAFLESAIYTSKREAFGKTINQFPMVQETLINLIADIEAAWAVNIQMNNAFDRYHTNNEQTSDNYAVMRILLSLGKYKFCELGVSAAKDAIELHGGNGYIEEYVTPRLFRDAMVNPVWEGTANIQSLEVMKLLRKGGFDPLVTDMASALNKITAPHLLESKQIISEELRLLKEMVDYVLQQDSEYQSVYAKKLADSLYDVYSSSHLLEEANYDWKELQDNRRSLVANYWVQKTFRPRRDRGILSGVITTKDLFHPFVRFEKVDVTTT